MKGFPGTTLSGAFFRDLDEAVRPFRRTASPPSSEARQKLGSALLKAAEALVLAEGVQFKVTGENVVLGALVEFLGLDTVEAFLESSAMRFVLWTPLILVVEPRSMPPESLPIVGGMYASSEFQDPHMSAEAGLRGWSSLNRRAVSRLAKKVAERTVLPSQGMTAQAIARTLSAHRDGDLRSIGIPDDLNIATITTPEKRALAAVASQLLEAAAMLSSKADLFAGQRTWGTLTSLCRRLHDEQGFIGISQETLRSERVPLISDLLLQGKLETGDLPAIRERQETKDYRAWLWEGIAQTTDVQELRDAYEALITGAPKSATETKIGRSVVNAAVSTLIGSAVAVMTANPALAAGAGMLTNMAQNILDAFWVENIVRERAPRRFATDVLRSLEVQASGRKALRALPGVDLPSHHGVSPRASVDLTMSGPLAEERIIPLGATLTLYED